MPMASGRWKVVITGCCRDKSMLRRRPSFGSRRLHIYIYIYMSYQNILFPVCCYYHTFFLGGQAASWNAWHPGGSWEAIPRLKCWTRRAKNLRICCVCTQMDRWLCQLPGFEAYDVFFICEKLWKMLLTVLLMILSDLRLVFQIQENDCISVSCLIHVYMIYVYIYIYILCILYIYYICFNHHAVSRLLIFKTCLRSLRLRSQLRESYSELQEHLNAKTVRVTWILEVFCGRIEAIYILHMYFGRIDFWYTCYTYLHIYYMCIFIFLYIYTCATCQGLV